jgi:hypothetical protein
MSFLKKLFAQEDLSPEDNDKREQMKAEKKAQREKEQQQLKQQREREREEKRAEKERQKQLELLQIEKFFGPNPGFSAKTNYAIHKTILIYIERNLLSPDEKILAAIPAEYDKTQKREIKGVLLATDQKLIFGSKTFLSEYIETFEYKKMNGISLANDGLVSKELYIDYGRSRKKFDDITNDDLFKNFLEKVREQITLAKTTTTKTNRKQSTPSPSYNQDKYKQLEQIGKLKEQGILTEEEFQAEKQKILNT